jgi:hypothetical protein
VLSLVARNHPLLLCTGEYVNTMLDVSCDRLIAEKKLTWMKQEHVVVQSLAVQQPNVQKSLWTTMPTNSQTTTTCQQPTHRQSLASKGERATQRTRTRPYMSCEPA